MHNWVLKLVVVSLLFVSIEGVAESVDDASFHQTHHVHADGPGNQWFPDSDDSDHEGAACEHFCHAHVVAVTAQVSLPNMPKFRQFVPAPSACSVTRATAPPTPPPNA